MFLIKKKIYEIFFKYPSTIIFFIEKNKGFLKIHLISFKGHLIYYLTTDIILYLCLIKRFRIFFLKIYNLNNYYLCVYVNHGLYLVGIACGHWWTGAPDESVPPDFMLVPAGTFIKIITS